jgi:hypothetical protein
VKISVIMLFVNNIKDAYLPKLKKTLYEMKKLLVILKETA